MDGKLFTKLFWKDATERALWTFAQVATSIGGIFIPVAAMQNQKDLETAISVTLASLPLILIASAGGALFSIVKSIAAAYSAGTDTASFAVDTKPLAK